MSYPLVSVIIVTFNRPKLISRSIDSILKQTYQNIEILIYDASTNDETKIIISAYKDERIKYYWIENEVSQANTLNRAFNEANGKYLALQDDDDESFPDRIAKQVQLIELKGSETATVYCWEEYYDDAKNESLYISKPILEGKIFKDLLLQPGGTGGGTQLLLSKAAIIAVGGTPENLRIPSDYLFMLKLSKNFHIYSVKETLIRTHINHIYGRLTTLGGNSKNGILGGIQLSEYILKNYAEDFDCLNVSKRYHYRTIALGYSKLKNVAFVKFYILYIFCKPHPNTISVFKDLLRLVRNIFTILK